MGLEHVPHEHVEMLLRNYLPDDEAAHWLRKARVRDPAARRDLWEILDEYQPGTSARLAALWFFIKRRAVHLWLAPVFEPYTTASRLIKRTGNDRLIRSPGWHSVDSGKRGHNRVTNIASRDDGAVLDVKVLLHTEYAIQNADLEKDRGTRAYTVDMSVNLDFETPVIDVHASEQSAKAAIHAFMEWVLESKVESRTSREQAALFRSLTFTESDIRLLAERQKWEECGLGGIDVTKEIGEIDMRGPLSTNGRHREPLNKKIPKVKVQADAPNDNRAFNVIYDHADGYQETAEVQFMLSARIPHMTFPRATSRTVVERVIGALAVNVARVAPR